MVSAGASRAAISRNTISAVGERQMLPRQTNNIFTSALANITQSSSPRTATSGTATAMDCTCACARPEAAPGSYGASAAVMSKSSPWVHGPYSAPAFRPHDLRRTCATRLNTLGVLPHIAEKILNHSMQGVMAVYNRADYEVERIEAMQRWALVKQASKRGTAEEDQFTKSDPARQNKCCPNRILIREAGYLTV